MSIHTLPSTRAGGLTTGTQPPDNGSMDARLTQLEDIAAKTSGQLAVIDKDLAIIKTQLDGFTRHYATKEDLVRVEGAIRADMHKEFTLQTWRIIGAMLSFGTLLSAVVFFIARNVKP